MRCSLLVVMVAVASAATADADSVIAFDAQPFVCNSPLDEQRDPGRTRFLAITQGQPPPPVRHDTLVGVDLRPSFGFAKGFRVAVGFRAGRASSFANPDGFFGDGGATLYGGDLGLGYQRPLGRFLPYAEVRFGFNSIELTDGPRTIFASQMRLDAVVGGRVYLGGPVYLAATVFGGLGDRFGGSLGLGWDIVRYRYRGWMP